MSDKHSPLSTAQIGRSGELLVQYRLLAYGIDSSSLTTDSGIDLVAYAPSAEKALTIQVKSNLRPKPAGGNGRPALDWWLREDSPADLVALTDLSRDLVWLCRHDEFDELAQQRSSGRLHFYMYLDHQDDPATKNGEQGYSQYLLERRVEAVFGLRAPTEDEA